MFPSIDSLKMRLARLSEGVAAASCDLYLVDSPVDLYYLTGLHLSVGKLWVTPEETCLMVDGRYIEMAERSAPCPVTLLSEKSVVEWVRQRSIRSIGFDQDVITYSGFLNLQKLTTSFSGGPCNLIPLVSLVRPLRLIKSSDEIELLRRAAELNWMGMQFVLGQLREQVTETQLMIELDRYWKELGAVRLAFDPIIAFGANSSMPHYRPTDELFLDQRIALFDIGVQWNCYHSDMTRVWLGEDPHPELRKIYDIVHEAKERVFERVRPGVLIGDLDRFARDYITRMGYGEYFNHSLGHGIGLEIHEFPTIRVDGKDHDLPLVPGMVFTVEPGIYLPGIGGVRLEDTIYVTEAGYENFYPSDRSPLAPFLN